MYVSFHLQKRLEWNCRAKVQVYVLVIHKTATIQPPYNIRVPVASQWELMFLILAMPVAEYCCLVVSIICISLMTNVIQQFFACLLAIGETSLQSI